MRPKFSSTTIDSISGDFANYRMFQRYQLGSQSKSIERNGMSNGSDLERQ